MSPTETDPGTLLLAILDNVGLSVAVIDENGKIAYANKKARTMWGEHSVVSGVSFAEWRSAYRFQDSDGREVPIDEAYIHRVLKGENMQPFDFRVILPDGTVRWMHETIERFSVFGITGLLVIMADETEAVLLRRAMQQLEQMGSLVQLARGTVHDLNNMFSAVTQRLYLARRDDLPQSTRDHLQQIELALTKGIGLAQKLGQFSRAQEFQSKPFEINHAVNTATELARPLFGSRVRLKLALASDLPVVEGDSGEIEQALVNLILNAVDAMPNGGEISLSTELMKRETHGISGEKSGWFVLLKVADTGVGIPEDIQPRIFEPFFTTKTEKRGTGLGLASVYGIVQHHKGEIKVHSVPGEGTTFTIYLPVREPAVHQFRKAG